MAQRLRLVGMSPRRVDRSILITVTDLEEGYGHYCDPKSELQPLTGVRGVVVMCGRRITPAALITPTGPPCRACENRVADMVARESSRRSLIQVVRDVLHFLRQG